VSPISSSPLKERVVVRLNYNFSRSLLISDLKNPHWKILLRVRSEPGATRFLLILMKTKRKVTASLGLARSSSLRAIRDFLDRDHRAISMNERVLSLLYCITC